MIGSSNASTNLFIAQTSVEVCIFVTINFIITTERLDVGEKQRKLSSLVIYVGLKKNIILDTIQSRILLLVFKLRVFGK